MTGEERPIVITESENDDGKKHHTDSNSDDLSMINDNVSTLALFYIFRGFCAFLPGNVEVSQPSTV